ncbi:ankyrin [Thraustotheca clavata]|uniref:Ankyrin n=1 Tax=Thraustotheca clavata TaxID=74557 RepID=A0A1V9YXY7_9STRA|nr:ankyrin [Thraustotheca clavata]
MIKDLVLPAVYGIGALSLALGVYEITLRGPLVIAAHEENVEQVKMLLMAGTNPNQTKCGFSVLFCAVSKGNVKIVKMLLSLGANVNKLSWGVAPLFVAAKNRYIDTVRALLEAKADPNGANKEKSTALLMAACQGDLALVEILLRGGADPNLYNNHGISPLYAAATLGYLEIARLLLGAGANPNHRENKFGLTPLLAASYIGNTELVKLLLAAQADVNLCAYRHNAILRFLGQSMENSNDGYSPLFVAVAHEYALIAQALIGAKADVNHGDEAPIMKAVEKGNVTIVRLLVQANARRDVTKNGQTLEMIANNLEEKTKTTILKLLTPPVVQTRSAIAVSLLDSVVRRDNAGLDRKVSSPIKPSQTVAA